MKEEIFPIYPHDIENPKRRSADVVGHSELRASDYTFRVIDDAKDVHIVDIENIDPDVPKAQFSTKGSACLDLYTRENCEIPRPGTGVVKIPLNVKIHPRNPNMYTRLLARSSTCLRYGLVLGNAVGIIDHDYSSEVCLLAFCMDESIQDKYIPKGTKIAQLEFCIKPNISLEEMKIQTTDDHKGFGSTGTK